MDSCSATGKIAVLVTQLSVLFRCTATNRWTDEWQQTACHHYLLKMGADMYFLTHKYPTKLLIRPPPNSRQVAQFSTTIDLSILLFLLSYFTWCNFIQRWYICCFFVNWNWSWHGGHRSLSQTLSANVISKTLELLPFILKPFRRSCSLGLIFSSIPKSVPNRCIIKVFWWRFCVVTLLFGFFLLVLGLLSYIWVKSLRFLAFSLFFILLW